MRKTKLKLLRHKLYSQRVESCILKYLRGLFVLAFLSVYPNQAWSGKLDLLTGYFDLEASVGDKKGQVSAVGAYKLSYAQSLFSPNLEIDLGYTLLMSSTFGGDLAYGVEAGVNYYPFSPASVYEGRSKTSAVSINPLWRPFVGGNFSQRQAQSTNSGYAGFGLVVGTERAIDQFFDLKGLVRYSFLSGPRSAIARELTVFIGITLPFNLGK